MIYYLKSQNDDARYLIDSFIKTIPNCKSLSLNEYEKFGIPDDTDAVVCLGMLNGQGKLAIQAKSCGIDFYHIDKAYFNRTDSLNVRYRNNQSSWWRVTKNDFVYRNMFVEQDSVRYQSLFSQKYPLQEMMPGKTYVLAIPPSEKTQRVFRVSFEEWEKGVRSRHLNQEVKIHIKPKQPDPWILEKALKDAIIVDCYDTSVVQYHALRLGVPVVGHENIDRHNMCCALSNNQFTIEEFQNGYAWEIVK